MGFTCEKAHYRTSHFEQSWIETIGCDQLTAPATAATLTPAGTVSSFKKHQKLRPKAYNQNKSSPASQHQSAARFPPASEPPKVVNSRTSLHYPFNLFHPFHSSSYQYSTIILDKLSQFITKHVAARSGSVWNTAPFCASPVSTFDKPSTDALASLHSHDAGSRQFPTGPPEACASNCQQPSPSPSSSCSKTSRLAISRASSTPAPQPQTVTPPSSSSSCDPLVAPVEPIGSTATTTGCTKTLPYSSSLPSEQASSTVSLSSSSTQASLPTPSSSGLRLPSTGPSSHQASSISSTTTRTTARPTSSHYLVRHSLCLYAASSVILALCYLTIPTVASDTPHTIFAEGKSDKEILDHLLKGSRYDKRLLPPVDDADFCCGMQTPEMAKHIPDTRVPGRPQNRGSLTVNVSVLLLSLASPDESSLKYEVEFLLQQQWYDPRLRYANQSSYEYLNAIHHHEDIWIPDTYFIMHGDFKDPLIPMHFALRIYRNGTINYLMRRHLILSCQGRLNIFPFDDPLCSFALESISYEQSAIRYVWKNDEDTLRKSPSLTTLNAYLIQNQTITCPIKASWRAEGQALTEEDEEFLCNLCQRRFEEQGNYSCLKVDLIFTRDRAFYFTTVFIPGIILVTSSFITFWLEWNAVPARSMIGVTTMLNFFTTSNGFRSTLPVVSNLTAMNVWDGVCMCFIYASLLEFVCVNYVGRKRPLHNVVYRPGENPVTQRLPAVLNRIGIILASPLTSRIFSETIENEFHTAIAAEKSATAATAKATRPGATSTAMAASTTTPPSAVAAATATSSATTAAATSTAALTRERVKTSTSASTTSPSSSRPTSVLMEEGLGDGTVGAVRSRIQRQPTVETKINDIGVMETSFGVKKRESSGPNEIVACTSCAGGTSPCTHSANNGCATETCFVQVRKKEPPHPIRVAKTIDVIARITFPSAYAVFLIFFFIHYKGFS
ncbi:gamma-aminobutyric acid receptor subunit theta isoform X4 [Ochlerotatus camptorhynchus]|uniref:gamma-aminobutyric acid receptor subunit theta isoform X4 n=1 Tax=Ochlerotatus camptorhynchus TaxID=644619 RepID=UPI0031D06EAA